MEQTDQQLLEAYQRTGDGAALQALIRRYLNQVYSSAVRQVRDRHLAEDVTQAVFILFSQKAAGLPGAVVVPGWLFRTTRYVSLHAMKKQSRRLKHEQLAARAWAESRPEQVEAEPTWQELSPSIDQALAQVKERYRDALILRFFQNMSLAQVGQAMGTSEEAARKLVDRGLEKLRGALASSGMACSEAGLVAALSQRVIETAPQQLAQWVAHVGTGAGAGASTNAMALTKGAITIMATIKVKAAVVVLAVAGVVGGGTVVVRTINAGPTSAPAPARAAQPAPTEGTQPAVVTQEVRNAAMELCAATTSSEAVAAEAFSVVESPQYQEMADALLQVISTSKQLRALMVEKFGAVPEEMQANLAGGPEVFRKQYLPNAPVRLVGDTASIDVGPGSMPPTFVFRREAGKWKLLIGQSFCGGKPEQANAVTTRSIRLAEALRGVADAVKAGECASAKDAAELLQTRLQPITPP